RGLIEVSSVSPGARGRKVYAVTDAGRREFHTWITGEPTGPDPETAALSRLFFLGLLEAEERPAVLRRITARLEGQLAEFLALRERLDAEEIPAEFHSVVVYQRATLEHGIASTRFSLDWFHDQLDRHE